MALLSAQAQQFTCGVNDVRRFDLPLKNNNDDGLGLQQANDTNTKFLYLDRPDGQVGNKLNIQSEVRLT